jgi:hypothetical protein
MRRPSLYDRSLALGQKLAFQVTAGWTKSMHPGAMIMHAFQIGYRRGYRAGRNSVPQPGSPDAKG